MARSVHFHTHVPGKECADYVREYGKYEILGWNAIKTYVVLRELSDGRIVSKTCFSGAVSRWVLEFQPGRGRRTKEETIGNAKLIKEMKA